MQPTLLANTWMVAHLPNEKYMALLCCAGSAGEAAFRNSLDSSYAGAGYEHLPATAKRRRHATYFVVGSNADDKCKGPTHRILHTRQRTWQHARQSALVLSNATTMGLRLSVVSLDLSGMLSVRRFLDGFMMSCVALTSVRLPLNIEQLGDTCFEGCSGLTDMDMSSLLRVRKIPNGFMQFCSRLTSFKFPPHVERFGGNVFEGCTSLSKVDMSSLLAVRRLPDYFLAQSSGAGPLQFIAFPPNVKEIGRHSLIGCIRLTEIDMSSLLGVRKLVCCLLGLTGLRSVKLPPNVEELGHDVLLGCTSLVEVNLGSLVMLKVVGNYLLAGCTSLRSVKLPPNVEELGRNALSGCTSLTELDMSALTGVRRLTSRVSAGCTSLRSVKLPPNVEVFGYGSLRGCSSLSEVDMASLVALRRLPNSFLVWHQSEGCQAPAQR